MFKEFKAFAVKGNLVDIAVGLILALAFTGVVDAFVDGILLRLIAAIVGEPSFDTSCGRSERRRRDRDPHRQLPDCARELRARRVGAVLDREDRQPPQGIAEEAGPDEIQLLTEIRDALRGSS